MPAFLPPASPLPASSPLPPSSPACGGIAEAIQSAKVLLELKTNRKDGPADYRRDMGALKEKIEEIEDEELRTECKKWMKHMNKVFVPKTHSSWRPFVLSILFCLGIPKAKLEDLLGTRDRATWDIFLESTVHDAAGLGKLICSKVKRISPQYSKEERQKRQQAEALAAAAEERQKLALLEMSPIKTSRTHDPFEGLTEEERLARQAAARHKAAESAERSKAFNHSYLNRHLQCIAAKKEEPIHEVLAELEQLGELILQEAAGTAKTAAGQGQAAAVGGRSPPNATVGKSPAEEKQSRPSCLKRRGSKRPWSDTQSCMS